jgi:menaquinone-dependent protoporphyrinogen oxidase
MSNKILVAYASALGSTAGVAEAIGQTLIESGAEVDVCRVQDVKDLSQYRAVIVGSAIRNHEWLPEAMEFLRKHQAVLALKPFATFHVCMTMSMKIGQYRHAVEGWLEPVRELVTPISEGYFAGALDIGKIPSFGDRMKFRISVLTGVWEEGDHRDWDAIRAWATDLAIQLHVQPQP